MSNSNIATTKLSEVYLTDTGEPLLPKVVAEDYTPIFVDTGEDRGPFSRNIVDSLFKNAGFARVDSGVYALKVELFICRSGESQFFKSVITVLKKDFEKAR